MNEPGITIRTWLAFLLMAGLAAPATLHAAAPSDSKLSIHLMHNYKPGAIEIVRAHPKVLKILDLYGPMMPAVREYKAGTPDGLVILRIYTEKRYAITDDPAVSALDFWNTVLAPPLNNLSPADRALIDYVEGPNEGGSTPTFANLQESAWFGQFWVALAPLIANAGYRPCAFSIAVGNPPGELTTIHRHLDNLAPALRKCKELGGAWSYHPYTIHYTKDLATESWFSLRYRRFYSYFATAHPDLVTLPLILTEGGVDYGGDPLNDGWQARGDAAKFQDWLAWYDNQIRQDSYLLGCTLFQSGAFGWQSFEVEPIANWLANHLIVTSSPVISRSPESLTVVANRGTDAPVQFGSVSNIGPGLLNFTVTDNANWLSVSPTSGISYGESRTLRMSFSTAGLGVGTYHGTISIVDPLAKNSPQTITVTLVVQEPPPPGDLDRDLSVDQADFALFMGCYSGPNIAAADTCGDADLDHDGDVDQSDFGIFQRCLSGPTVRADPNCAD